MGQRPSPLPTCRISNMPTSSSNVRSRRCLDLQRLKRAVSRAVTKISANFERLALVVTAWLVVAEILFTCEARSWKPRLAQASGQRRSQAAALRRRCSSMSARRLSSPPTATHTTRPTERRPIHSQKFRLAPARPCSRAQMRLPTRLLQVSWLFSFVII